MLINFIYTKDILTFVFSLSRFSDLTKSSTNLFNLWYLEVSPMLIRIIMRSWKFHKIVANLLNTKITMPSHILYSSEKNIFQNEIN